MDTKKCSGCGEEKELTEFHRDKQTRDGRRSDCKVCGLDRRAEYRAANEDMIRKKARVAYAEDKDRLAGIARKNYAKNKEQRRKQKREYYRKHRKQCLASVWVTREIVAGRMVPGPCDVCGSTERIVGHHDDYSKPFEVRWLCASHHKRLHCEQRRNNA